MQEHLRTKAPHSQRCGPLTGRLVTAALDVQLVLSGHTHGGQVIVPGFGAVAGRKFPVLAGYAMRENTALFVSRGVGTVYVPLRINCPPDVAVLTLRREVHQASSSLFATAVSAS